METSFTIDWLSFTDNYSQTDFMFSIPDFLQGEQTVPSAPNRFYRKAVEFESGVIIRYDGITEKMQSHYEYSGEALRELLRKQVTQLMINDWHRFMNHKATRIDLAMDVRNFPELNQFIEQEREAKTVVKPPRTARIVKEENKPGFTLYAGKRESPLFLRIYDKAAEQRVTGDWFRFEVEHKGRRAEQLSHALAQQQQQQVVALTRSALATMLAFRGDWWQALLQSASTLEGLPQRTKPPRSEWLLGTCAVSLGKELAKTGTLELWEEFVSVVSTASGISSDDLLDAVRHFEAIRGD